MIEIFKAPRVTRNLVAKKMIFHMLIAFVALGVSITVLFINMAKDSAANRDAVSKASSAATERWAAIVFIVFIAAIVYISVAGIIHSSRLRKMFTNWAYYQGNLYVISAKIPSASVYSTPKSVRRIMNLQDDLLKALNNDEYLIGVIENKIRSENICVIKVEHIDSIKESKDGIKVWFGGFKAKISKQTDGFDRLYQYIQNRAGNAS